jgi:opacity protein-like surface antigen
VGIESGKSTVLTLFRPQKLCCSGTGWSYANLHREKSNHMKRLAILSALALCLAAIAPAASAQTDTSNDKNHGNLGVYFDFTRIQPASLNMFGVGGRLGVNVRKHVVLEGEMAYDFERNKTQTITNGLITTTVRSDLRILHGLFGLKIQTTGPVRIFALAKGGFVNFGVSGPVTAGVINNQIGNIVDGDTKAAIYPGGGVEFNVGWLGLRFEAGDEIMLLNNGTTNNFRATFGPQIRF